MFVDETTIEVTAGRGGDGVTSFHREKYKPRGGPDGGDGGRGGDLVLVADPGVGTLVEYHFHPHQRAGRGAHGQGSNRKGADGDSRTLPVPIGTLVRDAGGELLADLDRPGAKFLAARGGRGGRGNAALSGPGRRVASFHEKGEPGRQRRLVLELRSLADAALVGFPNAGKSSIVARASAARPKVADYPFTTLEPVLGVVRAGDHDFVLADVPGLIPGAAAGKGLGHRFLRHVTRSAVLVHVLDLVPLEPGRDPEADLAALEAELAAYDPELADRPAMVVANKADLPEGRARLPEAEAAARRRGLPFFAVSAATGAGMREFLYALGAEVAQARAARPVAAAAPPAAVAADPEVPISVAREGAGFRVLGDRPERWVAMTDLDNPQAVAYLQRRMRRAGVDDLLASAGASPGDEVLVGDAAFEFTPDPLADPLAGTRGRERPRRPGR
ncbi:MAG TPA: GTPase ObgE [Actinomycetota bacterium]|jgi:GTP-binding protein|nr:GTPase ObgE [Actinomycetota bacterium]